MNTRSRFAFLALILTQAAHSVEEYGFRLYEVFAPARFISGLFGSNLAAGFAVANIAVVLLGVWCYAARVRVNHASARGWVWFWILLEGGNGAGHLLISLARGAYFPGVLTAPLLLGLSLYLALQMKHASPASQTTA
jgi:hypothetical protein